MISSRLTTRNLPTLFFLLVIFFLPQQFGPHFWPDFARVYGIRVDYLSPTFYISDLFIILLFSVSAKNIFKNKIVHNFFASKLFFIFLLTLLIPLFYAPYPLSLIYGLWKFSELLFLALYILTQANKKQLSWVIDIFVLNGLLESILAFLQFVKQSSFGNILYFVGERTFNTATISIATININGQQILRPYGTFPHPNILAFFLFTASVMGIYAVGTMKKSKIRLFYIISIVCIQLALFLTFSRVIIVYDLLFFAYVLIYIPFSSKARVNKNIFYVIFLFVLFLAFYFLLFNNRFFSLQSFTSSFFPRLDLIGISYQILLTHPALGVGLQQFFYFEALYQKSFSPIYLQPVHNMYVYLFTQIGLVGGAIFMFFTGTILLSLIRRSRSKLSGITFHRTVLFLFIAVLFTGLFDHFFVTTQQGELMLAVIIGMAVCANVKQ